MTLFDRMVKAGIFRGIEVTEPVTELKLPYHTLQVRARMLELRIGSSKMQLFGIFCGIFSVNQPCIAILVSV